MPVGLLQRRFHQRRVDELSATCLLRMDVRGEYGDRRQQSCIDVRDGTAALHRGTAGLAGDRHQTREALRNQIEAALVGPWTLAAVTGDRAIDKPWSHARQHV